MNAQMGKYDINVKQLEVTEDRILLVKKEEETGEVYKKTAGGVIVAADTDTNNGPDIIREIVKVGPDVSRETGLVPGKEVMMQPYSGFSFQVGSKVYTIVKQCDVMAVF